MRNIKAKALLLFLVLVISLTIVSSQEQYLGSFNSSSCINLLQTCTNCTFINISSVELAQPYSLQLLGEVAMEKNNNGIRYNYTFCNTSVAGIYNYWTYGDPDGSLSDPVGVSFDISQLGLKQTVSQSLGSLGFLFLMIVLMFVFGFIGIKLVKSDTWWILGIFIMFFSGLFLVYNTWLGYEYHHLFTGLPNSGIPETLFWIMFLIMLLGFFVSVTLLFLRWKEVFKYVKREIKRKDKDDSDVEDWDVDQWGGNPWKLPKVREPS